MQTMCSCVWLCVGISGYLLLYVAMCVHVWLCLVTGGHVWLCVLMCGYVLLGVPMCGYMWLCVAICAESPPPPGPVDPDTASLWMDLFSLDSVIFIIVTCICLPFSEPYLMTSAENSVLECTKLNIFWGRINCSPIGHNDTKHFLCPIRSRHLLEVLEIVR